MKRLLIAALLLASAVTVIAQDPADLKEAMEKAKAAVSGTKSAVEQRRELERLKKDLKYMAEEVDRDVLSEDATLALKDYSTSLATRSARLRSGGNIHAKLTVTLDRLDTIARDLPLRTYAEQYPASLIRAIADQLRWCAEESANEKDLLACLDGGLVVPLTMDGKKWFPTDLTLPEFLKLGPIRIFLVKHRTKRPSRHVATTAADLLAGKHHVQIGVEIEGVVTHHDRSHVDLDVTFDFGELHLEITPEWRLAHPKMHLPKTGERVRIKGWTYYDSFHKSEMEYDAADPKLGVNRATVWEVHPVQEVTLIQPAK